MAATTTISSGINTSAAADRDVTIQGTTIDLDGGITTDSGNLTFTGPVNVNGTAALDTGNAGGSTTAGNVTFTGIVYANDGTGDVLTIAADGSGTDGASNFKRWWTVHRI